MKDWHLVGNYTNGFELWRARSILEASGIPTYVENEHSQSVWGAGLLSSFPVNPAFGPLRLWVPLHTSKRVQAILEAEGLLP